MPGYHIRTAAGIVPVLDWYIKVLGPPSSTTSHAMTAATAGGGSKGYENGNGAVGQAAYGSSSPLNAGGLELRGLTWAQGAANEPTIVYLGPLSAATTPVPPDDDTSFSRIDITGTFSDGTGTRVLVRANADFTATAANGTRQWQFRDAKAAKFVSGNPYTAVLQRSTVVAPIITRVREAYVRTASGIQRYWPVDANTINVNNANANAFMTGSNGIAQYSLTNAGDVRATTGSNTVVDISDWIAPLTNFGDYSVRATVVSGTFTSGTFATWLNLGTTRTWTLNGGAGGVDATMSIEIRKDSDGLVRDTATIVFHAERDA